MMWTGKRQWEGLPGEFDVGQAGWAYTRSKPAGFFIFAPAFAPDIAWSYQVPCVAKAVSSRFDEYNKPSLRLNRAVYT